MFRTHWFKTGTDKEEPQPLKLFSLLRILTQAFNEWRNAAWGTRKRSNHHNMSHHPFERASLDFVCGWNLHGSHEALENHFQSFNPWICKHLNDLGLEHYSTCNAFETHIQTLIFFFQISSGGVRTLLKVTANHMQILFSFFYNLRGGLLVAHSRPTIACVSFFWEQKMI